MPTYRTPDVYIEEISVFPPSVAEVETAIPAFIGYTERATKIAAGLAAATGIGVPLTHRDHAQGVMLVTGHAREGGQAPDWAVLGAAAAQGLTLVVYMGMTRLNDLQAGLLNALPAATPVAVVQHASLPTQRHAVGRLDGLAQMVATHRLASPAVLIVGQVLQGLAQLPQPLGLRSRGLNPRRRYSAAPRRVGRRHNRTAP